MFSLSTSADNMSLFEELWNYFYDTYFVSKSLPYENLGLGSDALGSIGRFFIGIFIGLILASAMMVYTKRVLGKFVRYLLENEINSADKAVRLAQTGFVTNFAIRASLRAGRTLRTVVCCREEDEYLRASAAESGSEAADSAEKQANKRKKEREFKVDLDAHHFYIPEEKKYQADMRFDKKGTSWGGLVLLIIVLIFTFFAIMIALPSLLEALDSLLA